jgi:deoxyribodipyrimidine photo-lyase
LHNIEGQMPTASFPMPRPEPRKPSSDAVVPVLIWVHTGALNPRAEAFARYADAASCFVWDEAWLAEEKPSVNRIRFLDECLAEMPATMTTRRGDLADEIVAAAKLAGARSVVAMTTVDPRLLEAAEKIERHLPVVWVNGAEFVRAESVDLKRFSRYWSRVKQEALRAD